MISAGWTTNGAGDSYSLMDERVINNAVGNKVDIWSIRFPKFKSCVLDDLLNSDNCSLLARRIFDDGYSLSSDCKYSIISGKRSVVINNEIEYRSQGFDIYVKRLPK